LDGRERDEGVSGGGGAGETAGAFVVACLRGRLERGALEEARRLAGDPGLDWEAVAGLVAAEGLGPLLYHTVRGRGLVPAAVEEAWGGAYDGNVLRNTCLFHELEAALQGLAGAGVETLLLKGAALSKALYGSAAVRTMGDIDLLVRPDDVAAAVRTLSALGYESEYAAGLQARDVVPYNNQLAMHKPGPVNTLIELHWHLFWFVYYRHTVALDWFWQSAQPVEIGAARSHVLGPEAQILHLCGHWVGHQGQGQPAVDRWGHDIAEVVFRYGGSLDWDAVLSRAREFHLVLPTQQVLAWVREAWQAPIPGEVLGRLGELRATAEEARAFHRFRILTSGSLEEYSLASLASLPRWGMRLRYAWRNLLFPSSGFMRHRYRIRWGWLVPLYYPYRWWLGLRSAV
jgi:hypothetical protein